MLSSMLAVKSVVRLLVLGSASVCSSLLVTQSSQDIFSPFRAQCTASSMISQADIAKREALWGMFVADAVAMPVHLFYDPNDIKRSYGDWLSGYMAPTESHPSSILNLSSIGGSGRSGGRRASKPVVGNVILHDKAKYWTSGKKVHYHRGMSAGDSTLNALAALETIKVMQFEDPQSTLELGDLQAKVMENYVDFMTTPGSHNDTYAESFHRLFFKEWSEMEDPPHKGEDIVRMAEQRYTDTEARLMVYEEGTGNLGSACYIDGAMPSMLMLALGFHDDFSGGVLTNANCGGENAHRGAALGALLGANTAINGKEIPLKWKEGLQSAKKHLNQATTLKI